LLSFVLRFSGQRCNGCHTTSTAPKAKGTAGYLIVWFKAVLFAQKLYIQSSLIGALARSKPKGSGQVFMILAANPPHHPEGIPKGSRHTEGVRPSFHDVSRKSTPPSSMS
jgi:hypothetical protein